MLILILGTQLFSELYLVKKDMYYIIPWLDIPMHIWGGFLFGTMFVYVYEYINRDKLSERINLKHLLVFVFLIGVIWELYEYVFDVIGHREWRGLPDSLKDLFDDLLGACLAYLFISKK